MIRVMLDANVLISFVLNRRAHSTVPRTVALVISPRFRLIVPQELLSEVEYSLANRPYLREHVPAYEIDVLRTLLEQYGESPAALPSTIDSHSRDPKDDYLLAYALVEQVDFLITGDKDLLILGQLGRLEIVTPRQFLDRFSPG